MRPAGSRRTLALWREAGEWWRGEPQREIERFVDDSGIRREEIHPLAPVVSPGRLAPRAPYVEDNSEEISLRVRKVRDEKVARACGYAPADPMHAAAEAEVEASLRFAQEREATYADSSYAASMRPARERRLAAAAAGSAGPNVRPYAALHVVSGYAFGRGTMLAEEIPILAARFGLPAVALADPHSLVGAVEFVKRAQAAGVKPLVGAEIELPEGGRIVLLARSKAGYQSLSQLVTACHLEEPRLAPLGSWERLERFSRDLLCLTGGSDGPVDRLLLRGKFDEARKAIERLAGLYGRNNVFLEIEHSYLPWEIALARLQRELAEACGVLPVAGGPVTHARREHFPAQDVLVCVETLCTVEEILGRKPSRDPSQPSLEPRPARALNAERFLRTPAEMAALYAGQEDLLDNTLRVANRCDDDVLPARTQLPQIAADPGHMLREAVWAGAFERHRKIEPRLKRRLEHELDRIVGLNFAGHFLVIWDACRWARGQGILYSGRGSVVDSAVAYCLGLSRIDAYAHNLHFDRFLPEDGSKRPDIDVDFEAKRRDDVRNYLSRKYGPDRVATVAAVGAYCSRGIVREVGKALGLPGELIGFLAKRLHGGVTPDQLESALEKRPELRGSGVPKERFRWVFDLAERLMDVPRNIRAHSSGVVISGRPLAETVPVIWSASVVPEADEPGSAEHLRIIQWDKRSAKYFFDKFDILCLRGQDVLSGVQRRVKSNSPSSTRGAPEGGGEKAWIEDIPLDDEEAYRAMRSGELIGIPQSASPAMRQAHIRLRTANLHDASLVQAGIRPGVGGAVKINELIARRRGKPYTFDHPELEHILGLTYGIIVFQEQVDQLLQTFAGCSSGEAEDLREAIHKRRREDYGRMMRDQILARIVANGYSPAIAEQVYEYVSGFKGYGFAQGHALAFAEISIRSIHCQQNYPSEYFAAMLSAQPAGYYGPCTLANEARVRGVALLHPDVNRSQDEFTAEDVLSPMDPKIVLPNGGIRIGLMQVMGLSEETKRRIIHLRNDNRRTTHDELRELPQAVSDVCGADRSALTACGSSRRVSVQYTPRLLHSSYVTAIPPHSNTATPQYRSFYSFCARVRPSRDELEALILCGALDGICPNRRAMLWAIPQAQAFAESCADENGLGIELPEPEMPLEVEDFDPIEKAIHERRLLDLDVETHLMAFERERIAAKGGITAAQAKRLPNRTKAIVVGNPIRLRFPPTPSGKRVVFFDLEDETGLLNVTCFDAVYRRDGHTIVCSPYVTLIGESQDRDGHMAFLAHRVFPYSPVVANRVGKSSLPIGTADFLVG
jgi:error-prone DNA polymerase